MNELMTYLMFQLLFIPNYFFPASIDAVNLIGKTALISRLNVH
jgi:hypothetical protein